MKCTPLLSCRLVLSPKRSALPVCAPLLLSAFDLCAHAAPPAPYPLAFEAGTPAEETYLLKTSGARLANGARHAEPNQFWVYGFPLLPSTHVVLHLTLQNNGMDELPAITVNGLDNKPLPIRIEREDNDGLRVIFTVPDAWPVGTRFPVIIGARTSAISVHSVRLEAELTDTNGDGLPDAFSRLLTDGFPVGTKPTIYRMPTTPYTVTIAASPPTPERELPADAVLLTVPIPATAVPVASAPALVPPAANVAIPAVPPFEAWKKRGYATWAQTGLAEAQTWAAAHPDETQMGSDNRPLAIFQRPLLFPTDARLAAERQLLSDALTAGVDGINVEENGFATAGAYGPRFQAAWQAQYRTGWLDPLKNLNARFQAGQLMATLTATRVTNLLQSVLDSKPLARRVLTLRGPIFSAQSGLVATQTRLSGLAPVQDVVGSVSAVSAQTPLRYAGLRSERAFASAYLENSALYQLLRGTNKRLWFTLAPHEADAQLADPATKERFTHLLTAALLFPDVDAYELLTGQDDDLAHTTPDEIVTLNSLLALLEEMHNMNDAKNSPASGDIGVLLGDSAQWQRDGTNKSDMDGFFGLCLPLLQRGVPLQVVALDRAADPGYLNGFKTLLLSYDFQKPLGARTQTALADWVRRGGSLIFAGGSDVFNSVESGWWRQASLATPQTDLWTQLQVPLNAPAITRQTAPEDLSRYKTLGQGRAEERARRPVTFDLTPYAAQTGSVAVRLSNAVPNASGSAGVTVGSGELRVNGIVAASFAAGSEIENRFLVADTGSQFDGTARYALSDGAWSYQFDNLPRNASVTLTLDIGSGYQVAGASARPDVGSTLLSTPQAGPIASRYPRLRVGAAYPVTLYPDVPTSGTSSASDAARSGPVGASLPGVPASGGQGDWTPLYTLRAGGTPIWARNAGRGLLLNVGVAPGFFAASERSGGLLRRLVQYAHQRAGGTYREPGLLQTRRGRYTIVHTFGESQIIEGRTVDVLSPTLAVADDRVVPPRSSVVVMDAGLPSEPPHLIFAAGRLQAKMETSSATAFMVRGPLNTPGVARLHRGNRRLSGARGLDVWGRPVPVQATEEGGTILVRYANQPDGVIVRVGWQ